MRTIPIGLLGAVALSACNTPARDGGAKPADASSVAPPAAPVREATVRALMHGHEKLAEAVRDALVRGDLDEAKSEAKLLSEQRIAGPTGPLWAGKVAAYRAAAGAVAAASDLKEAGRGLGMIAMACGDCHTEYGRPGILVEAANVQASGVRAYMQRHEWAAERLWDGLVVPSDDAWNAGALALSEGPLSPDELTPGKSSVPRVGELAGAVHDLAHRAVALDRAGARAQTYGQVLATCAECHQWLGGGPGAAQP
jgi:cytochrome c553